MKTKKDFERGSEWRQWDLHIHTPASFHWTGQRFEPDNWEKNRKLVDEMIEALNAAEPAVFTIMDYWTFDGWFNLKRRLKELGSPELKKKVFPGIELRLAAPTKRKCRLNAHVLFSDEIEDHILNEFKAGLELALGGRSLSEGSLIEYARKSHDAILSKIGSKKSEVIGDAEIALIAGSKIAEITCESYKRAISRVPNRQAIGFMPYDTSDGLDEVDWQENYAYFLSLFNSSPIFETRNIDRRCAFVGEETKGNSKWIKNFQYGLGNIPRLAVSGSDAHRFIGVKGDNDKRGYGDFPSGKITWIKADPNFLGLLQAIREPAKRSYIGVCPEKLQEIEKNKTFFIDRVNINKNSDATVSDSWFDGVSVPLNPDLVAIIGNKGNGKSALADIIALLGNAAHSNYFSFLVKERFRGKTGEPAKSFTATIRWLDDSEEKRCLNENPPSSSPQLVRYIPQGYFEKLCNSHASGQSFVLQKELETVIFDHADEAITLGALDFDQLVEQQEGRFRDQLNEYRKELSRINREIEFMEAQSQPEIRQHAQELFNLKKKQVEAHDKVKPDLMPNPSENLAPEQQKIAAVLDEIVDNLKKLDEQLLAVKKNYRLIAQKRNAINSVHDRIQILKRQYAQFQHETLSDFSLLNIGQTNIVSLVVDETGLATIELELSKQEKETLGNESKLKNEQENLLQQQFDLKAKLDEPQRLYQERLKAIEQWQAKLQEHIGSADSPETLEGLKARLAQLDKLPEELKAKRIRRIELTGEIFDVLNNQREARERLFKPVQDVIRENSLIRDKYRLQFLATLSASIDRLNSSLFDLIKQKGEFRGEDESRAVAKRLSEQYDFNLKEHVCGFVDEFSSKIHKAASNGDSDKIGVVSLLRKDRAAFEVYDLIFGLTYLEPKYSLLFQDAQIEQLSPGQRGALLLIFYLLVDKWHNPIIIDQPEENLDNETVVSLLVPVITEAKKRRQIIMVTHNPNLAVVCDAEQVIYSSFGRKEGFKISYLSGSIENPAINEHVINVLEGTKPAFNNRKNKYHK